MFDNVTYPLVTYIVYIILEEQHMPLVTLVHVPIYSQVLASQLDISLSFSAFGFRLNFAARQAYT